MLKYIAMVTLILALIPGVHAAEDVTSANKFLSAETARQIQASQDEMLQELKNYQDENFGVLDQRMGQQMQDMRLQVLLVVLGAGFVSIGIASFIVIRATQRYSYEKFQEDLQKKAEKEQELYANAPVLPEQQQPEWYPQQPMNTVGQRFGQTQASQMSDMNAWQYQPPYAGAWTPPQEDIERDWGYYQ